MRTTPLRQFILFLALIPAACTSGGQAPASEGGAGGQSGPVSGGGTPGSGGASQGGGSSGTGGVTGSGGSNASGGTIGSGGSTSSGSGGSAGAGGTTATGGVRASGGVTSTGGSAGSGSGGRDGGGSSGSGQTGGTTAAGGQGGSGTGGATISGTGGRTTLGTGGRTGTGGAATGGSTSTSTEPSTIDCNAVMPTGGTDHCGQNTQGTAGGLSWSLWSNAINSNGCITTFSVPAFSARWNNNSDFLARIGFETTSPRKTYDQYGIIKADFAYKKTGTAGGFSYIGIYGWSNEPCVEYYIIDDRWGTMPFNAYNATLKGTVSIDGEDYKLFSNSTTGTGGSRCNKGETSWMQFWSIRQKARQCGTITVSDHFKAWDAAGMKMGVLLEAKILVETGGGTGNIEFPVANVTKSQ